MPLTDALKQTKLGSNYELLELMGVSLFKGLFKLPGESLTTEDIAERVNKFNPDLSIENATAKVPKILEMEFPIPNGRYNFVEIHGKYRLEYHANQE